MIAQTTKNRQSEAEWLARDIRRDADGLDALAADVAAWGLTFDPLAALGLIERAQLFVAHGERFVQHDLYGERTHAYLRNEGSIALGVTNGHSDRGRGDMGYGLMYALKVRAEYPNASIESVASIGGVTTKASSIRVYASSLRVVADMLDSLVSGRVRYIR